MICFKCNQLLPDDSDFCQYCGCSLADSLSGAPARSFDHKTAADRDNPKPEIKQVTTVHLKKEAFLHILVLVIIIFSLGANIYQHYSYSEQKKVLLEKDTQISNLKLQLFRKDKTISDLTEIIDDKSNTIASMKDTLADQALRILDYRSQVNFMNDYIVFVSDDGTNKYHNYDCPSMDWSNFVVYNTDAAISKGYKFCTYCNLHSYLK